MELRDLSILYDRVYRRAPTQAPVGVVARAPQTRESSEPKARRFRPENDVDSTGMLAYAHHHLAPRAQRAIQQCGDECATVRVLVLLEFTEIPQC